ncbi:hypothetical protein SBDP1_220012 [Syntrophobacter sp. SbD1]|nr:hypothetical protein SBDP1_220012 [Syntrophobacter sp. SbD1]
MLKYSSGYLTENLQKNRMALNLNRIHDTCVTGVFQAMAFQP